MKNQNSKSESKHKVDMIIAVPNAISQYQPL